LIKDPYRPWGAFLSGTALSHSAQLDPVKLVGA
jgi:hypothetical protein